MIQLAVCSSLLFVLIGSAAAQVPFAEFRRIAPASGGSSLTAGRVVTAALDIDGDGDLDVVTCVPRGIEGRLLAWENDGGELPLFRVHNLGFLPGTPTALTATDLDGDGDPDLVAGSAAGGALHWFENLGAFVFRGRPILPVAEVSSLGASDLDGDGAIDVCAVEGAALAWLENDGQVPPSFVKHSVSTTSTCLEQVRLDDLDRDGDVDLLSISACENRIQWHEHNGASVPGFTEHVVTTGALGVSDVSIVDIDRDGDLDFASANAGDQKIQWFEQINGAFNPHDLAVDVAGVHSLHAVDLDEDGDPDLVSSSTTVDTLTYFENRKLRFVPHPIPLARPSAELVLTADLDQDGDRDLLASLADGSTGWLPNRSLHGSAFLPTPHTVEAVLDEADEARPADIDGDGDLDVIAISRGGNLVGWWNNLDGHGRSWQATVIDNAVTRASACDAADLDGDGDLDVVGASFTLSDVLWWENLAGDGSAWQRRTIDATLAGAQAVAIADIDGDGDLDVFANGETADDVTWYENLDGRGRTWSKVTIDASFDGANFVRAMDVDGDGDCDVASAARNGDEIAWWENADGAGQSWTFHSVALGYDLAAGLDLADVDGDGDVDVLGVSFNSDEITWFENLDRVGGSFAKHVIDDEFTFAIFVAATDLDGDGDTDVVGAAHNQGEISWFENLDGTGSLWMEHPITIGFDIVTSSVHGDLDGDGDLDVLGAAAVENKIVWWENRGGQFAAATSSLAPPTLSEGEQAAVLEIDVIHRGRDGDGALRLSALALLLEETPGDPLTSTEADLVLRRVRIFADDGSGTFEEATDVELARETAFDLVQGVLLFEFPPSIGSSDQTPFTVAHGAPRTLFVVIELEDDAADHSLATLELSHGSELGDRAVDDEHLTRLQHEFSASVSTGPIQLVDG